MKKIILVSILTTLSWTTFAKSNSPLIKGTVDDVVCAEMDPFAVGDACVVFSTDENSGAKLGLVYRDYDWYSMFVDEPDSETDTVGDHFTAEHCEKINSANAIQVLKDFNSEYFYMNCDLSGFSWR